MGAVWLVTGVLVAWLALPGLYWDEWDHADLWLSSRDGGFDPETLWQPHNEHRPVVSRALFFTALELGWPMSALMILSHAALGGALWLLAPLIGAASSALRPAGRVIVELAMAAFFLSWAQWENLLNGMQVGFAAAVLAAAMVARGVSEPANACAARWLIGGVALAYLSTPLWIVTAPLVLVDAWRRGASAAGGRWARPAAAGALLGGLLLLYVAGLERPAHHPSPLYGARHPGELLDFLLLLCGGAFANGGLVLPRLMGLAFVAGSAVVLGLAIGRRERLTGLDSLGLGTLALSLGAACVLALGRAGLGPDAALASRYTSLILMGWLALLCALARPCARLAAAGRRDSATVALAVGIPLVVGIALSAARLYQVASWTMPRRAAAAACLDAVLEEPALFASRRVCLEAIYPDPERLVEVAGRLSPGAKRAAASSYSRPSAAPSM